MYDGVAWSFDSLYNAVNSQAIVTAGKNNAVLTVDYNDIVKNDDGTYTGSFVVTAALPDLTNVIPTDIECCNYERYYNGDGSYDETPVEFEVAQDGGTWTITFTVPAELAADYATGSGTSELEPPEGYTGFDLYYDLDFNGTASSTYYSVTDYFEVG